MLFFREPSPQTMDYILNVLAAPEAFRVALPILLLEGARVSLPAAFCEALREAILQSEIP